MRGEQDEAVLLSPELLQMARRLAGGDAARGVSRALRAATVSEGSQPTASQLLRGVAVLAAGLEAEAGMPAALSVRLRGLVGAVTELEDAAARAALPVPAAPRPRCECCGCVVLQHRTLPLCATCHRRSAISRRSLGGPAGG